MCPHARGRGGGHGQAAGAPVATGAPTHATTTVLKIRGGRGGTFGEVSGSPLPQGAPLVVIATQGEWRQVVVPGPVRGQTGLHGWVHGSYLRAVAPQIRVVGPTGADLRLRR